MAVTLEDIARDTNVSVSVVSRILNGRLGTTGASRKTIETVRTRAQQLGYRKNTSALALVSGRQHVLGVLVHQHGERGSGLVESMLEGVAEEAQVACQRLQLHFFTHASEFRTVAMMQRNVVDGVLLAGIYHGELLEDLRRIQTEGVAVVTLHPMHDAVPEFTNVGVDQAVVGYMATRHLLARGCRRIARIAACPARLAGFYRALAEAGVDHVPEAVFHTTSYNRESGQEAARSWLAAGLEFDGLVADSDHQAVGAMHVLLKAGRRVPEEIKVIGVDDAPFCDLAMVPLTSMTQESRECGRIATRLLLAKLDGKAPKSVTVNPVLKERESTAWQVA